MYSDYFFARENNEDSDLQRAENHLTPSRGCINVLKSVNILIDVAARLVNFQDWSPLELSSSGGAAFRAEACNASRKVSMGEHAKFGREAELQLNQMLQKIEKANR